MDRYVHVMGKLLVKAVQQLAAVTPASCEKGVKRA